MKQAILQNIGVLLVELPKGAYITKIRNIEDGSTVMQYTYPNGFNTLYERGKYIGKLSALKESDFEGLVKAKEIFDYTLHFWEYTSKEYSQFTTSAKESFLSALAAEKVYLENPLGEGKPDIVSIPLSWDSEGLQSDIEKWKAAQSRTFDEERTFVFKILY